MRIRTCLALGLLAAAVAWASGPAAPGAELQLPDDVFAAAPDDAIQDVLLLTDARPLFLRFRVRIAGESFRATWSHFVDRLHGYLDSDGDGVLTLKEAQRSNWQQLFDDSRNFRGMLAAPVASASSLDSQPQDGTVTRDELAQFLRTKPGTADFGIQPGAPPDPKSQALFALLDDDRDGTLSPAERAPAALDALLARLDQDQDELISLPELRPFENPYGASYRGMFGRLGAGAGTAGESRNSPIVQLGPGTAVSKLAERLLSKYDRGTTAEAKDGRLSCAELGGAAGAGAESQAVRRFDANGDGGLGAAELVALLQQPVPDIALDVVLPPAGVGAGTAREGEGAGAPATLTLARSTNSVSVTVRATSSSSSPSPAPGSPSVSVVLEGAALEIAIEENLPSTSAAMDRQFNQADGDGNGYVDKSEAAQYRNFQQFFDVADRDHDGKLTRAELELYLERQSDARRSRVMLAFGDHGRNLFELLDADGDRRLGLRELRQAGALLAAYDPNGHGHGHGHGHGDDRVARSAVARVYRLGIGRGLTPLRPAVNDPYASPNVLSLPGGREAPAWFAKMDRNRDGDVSRREFLGTPDQFRRLDDDGDGLIDPREAGGKQ